MTECVICTRPEPDAFACPACTAELREWLTDLSGHATDLAEVVLPGLVSRSTERVFVRGEGETPLPFNETASEAAWVLRNTLVAITRSLCEDRGLTYTGTDQSSSSLAHWLSRHVESIAQSPDFGETYDLVRTLAVGWRDDDGEWHRSDVLRAVDTKPAKVFLGPCDGNVDGKVCDKDVRAAPGRKMVTCGHCMTTHDVANFQVRVLRRMGESLMTANELSAALRYSGGPKADTISKWKRPGWRLPTGEEFDSAGRTPEGADLFRVDHFLAMASTPRRRVREPAEVIDRPEHRLIRSARLSAR